MSQRKVRDATTILGMLDGGNVAHDLSTEITGLLEVLRNQVHGRPKATAKGKVTLVLDFKVDGNGATEVDADIAVKKPKLPRSTSFYWTLPDGSLSTEHPQQTDLFAGPREIQA